VNGYKYSQPELGDMGDTQPTNGFVYIRDDVLKMLYPDARAQSDLEDLYMKNGGFTEEEIFDIPIKSNEDFVKLLYDIKALNLTDGNQKIFPTFAFAGGDNSTKRVELALKQNFFKENLKLWNQLVADDVASQESLAQPSDAMALAAAVARPSGRLL
jgi:hypothetical protein